jgi:hypothetical protein
MSTKKKGNKPEHTGKLQPTESKISAQKLAEPISKTSTKNVGKEAGQLLFTRENYKWILIGIGVMILGFALMSGGAMPDANTWDPGRIYSFRRITLAPIVVLIGIGIEIYAVFVKPKATPQ